MAVDEKCLSLLKTEVDAKKNVEDVKNKRLSQKNVGGSRKQRLSRGNNIQHSAEEVVLKELIYS